MEPAITILMPVFNGERFLGEAIESILNQTFANFEFLIIDDGSTDKTVQIVNSYCDRRIRLIKNEKNLGISKSLNKGINLARANLIARMDADDISYPDRLEKQHGYLATHSDCALLSTAARVITEDKQTIYIEKTRSEYFYYNLTFHSPIYHPTVIYRKTAVQDVGMYTVPYSEDFELFWHLSRKYKIHNLPDVLLDYRISPQSLHQVKKKKEYDQAALAQTLRNLRFYAGENFTISESCLKCLQYDVEPLVKQNNIKNIIKCFRQLDLITGKIISTENINRDINAIRAASRFKKKYTLSMIANRLPRGKALLLLLSMAEFQMLFKKTGNFLKRKIRAMPIEASMLHFRLRHWFRKLIWGERSAALTEEIEFWRQWFVTGGLEWPDDFRERFDPQHPIQDHIATYIDRIEENPVRILDVGSGPMSKLGKKHPSRQVIITATDLLASRYDRLLSELGIKPLVRTIFGDAEKLSEQFGQNAFDIVHAQNSIDHTTNPMAAIRQMIAVCKPLGYVILHHAENEGEREHYHQLHKWNFTCENGDFIIRDQQGRITNVTKELASEAKVTCMRDSDSIQTVINKKAN